MSKNITIRTDLYNILKELKHEGSFSDVIDSFLLTLTPATIDNEGRFEQSRTLKGKTILYRIQDNHGVS